jgi:hypothetical protein
MNAIFRDSPATSRPSCAPASPGSGGARTCVADYPASSWTLKYWFKQLGASGEHRSPPTADGDNFAVSVAAATTAAYTAGDYAWAAEVSAARARSTRSTAAAEVLARYDQAANLDDRTHARKMLDAIEALLEGRARVDQQEYTIGSRGLKRMPAEGAHHLARVLRGEVAAEEMGERCATAAAATGSCRSALMGVLDKVAALLRLRRPRPARSAAATTPRGQISRLTASLQTEAQFINTTLRYQGASCARARARRRRTIRSRGASCRWWSTTSAGRAVPPRGQGQVRAASSTRTPTSRIEEAWEAGAAPASARSPALVVEHRAAPAGAHAGRRRRAPGAQAARPEYGRYGYKLQIIDVDRLYELKNQALAGGGAIHAGVEVDPPAGRSPITCSSASPSQWQYSGYIRRLRARAGRRDQHVFVPEFAEQIRGVPMDVRGAAEPRAPGRVRGGGGDRGARRRREHGLHRVARRRQGARRHGGRGPNVDGTDGSLSGAGDPQISAEPGVFHAAAGLQDRPGLEPEIPGRRDRARSSAPACAASPPASASRTTTCQRPRERELLERAHRRARRARHLDGMQQFWCEHFNQPLYDDWLRMQVLTGTLPFDPRGWTSTAPSTGRRAAGPGSIR